ncbi:MAG: hypothetical protein HYY10_02465 [Candidatus Liptonbacteria bacterium]|nr:hypothetical protein [Candidatus Liptonbacteria bacterium]
MARISKKAVRGALAVVILGVGYGWALLLAHAATPPQIVISWRADTYTPPGYAGKALPTSNSVIAASLDILANNKGTDLSGQLIYWYVNNRLAGSGKGRTSITFRAPSAAPDTLALRVEVPGYPGGAIIKSINIPVVVPESVIVAPLPLLRFTPPSTTLTGAPYFFNVRDPLLLKFEWGANYTALPAGQTDNAPKGDPRVLTLNLNPDAPKGAPVRVTLGITNPLREAEGAQSFITLTTQ